MGLLTNSPPPGTLLRLEQRKSFSLGVYLQLYDGHRADITGHLFNFIMAKAKHLGGDIVVDEPLTVPNPLTGFCRLDLQALDLDLEGGDYDYSVSVITPEGYSGVLFKGIVEIVENTSLSTVGNYAGDGLAESVTLTLQRNNSITLKVGALVADLNVVRTDAIAARDRAEAAAVGATTASPVFAAPSGGDDWNALQAALNAIGGNGGRLRLRPSSTYLLSDTLVVPTKVVLEGLNRDSSKLKAHASFGNNKPLVRLGSAVAQSFASRVENLTIDADNRTGSIGVACFAGQEDTGLDRVVIGGFKDIGVSMAAGCANFDIDNLEVYPSTGGANKGIYLNTCVGANALRRITVGVNALLTVGIHVNGGTAHLSSIHAENCTDGVLFAGADGSAIGVTGPTGGSNVTNLVRVDGSSRYVFLAALTRNGATHTAVSTFFGKTVDDTFVQQMVVGDGYVGRLNHYGDQLAFFGHALASKPTVTGSRGGNAALASALTALAGLGLITDSSS